MKKLVIILCMLLALVISGCGNKEPGHYVTAAEVANSKCKERGGVNGYNTRYSMAFITCRNGKAYQARYGGWANDSVTKKNNHHVKQYKQPTSQTRNDVLN